ncbi:putative bifunctional diguanylate cyclase/phosphodiesterase [Vibrio cortegadensis]|uniref:putative bifunctional diguanylate cyclase/phosphodiesterase n=1 Tax=Vibrio cortegadensis TaxID=1328770 RepID=UPI00352D3BBC
MPFFSMLLVTIGIALLIWALTPAQQIKETTNQHGWNLLCNLIRAFIIGYSLFLYSLLNQAPTLLITGLSLILFGGSIFVVMVIHFSSTTIKELDSLVERERFNAQHDSLTSLPNRQYCMETINRKIKVQTGFTTLLLDVVNFKQVNDAMGHACGDRLLIKIGQRISELLSDDDFMARIGGDEFVLVINKMSHNEILTLINLIDMNLRRPFSIDGFEIASSAVFGASQYPKDGETPDTLINHADIAMYHAKQAGKLLSNYTAEMSHGAKRKLQIASQLQLALDHDEFVLFYQPIISTETGLVASYEALIRWNQPNGEQINSSVFIHIAEQSNKITQITQWVLKQVELDIIKFQNQGLYYPVHVNLSGKDVLGNTITKLLTDLVQRTPTIAQYLVLEITESTAISKMANLELIISQIKELGFSISLDDFGTGYSSLSLLKDLPIDQIKIDRSFIQKIITNKRNQSIVVNTIALAHGLGYSVVAEGIEHPDTLHLLTAFKCDYIQGHYYSAALSIQDAINWSQQHNAEVEYGKTLSTAVKSN